MKLVKMKVKIDKEGIRRCHLSLIARMVTIIGSDPETGPGPSFLSPSHAKLVIVSELAIAATRITTSTKRQHDTRLLFWLSAAFLTSTPSIGFVLWPWTFPSSTSSFV
ncbi:hypothetical protein BT63DRAFT_460866 [Microthyrium microscopicum]|uniref:Uncharacterized protein n=1 Tax=Microthyrium microscopicum TaxID=703497 RepID=A0A6A6TUK3_9PEZI|nr:hypothetical protein BT63DRAFT_460866 [Microthyrium microscopicum]